jgi:hypothetical protein
MPYIGGAPEPRQWLATKPIAGELPKMVDVVVRPVDFFDDFVSDTIDVTRIWGEEIVLRDVLVQSRSSQ